MNILYAAGNRPGSFFQMKRFLDSVKNKGYQIKTAAYKNSMGNLDVDYCLDCLLNFTNPNSNISFNGNYSYYHNEIERFKPDLIISDMEIYTSMLALELKIKLWQVSPIMLYYGMNNEIKSKTGIHKNYLYLLDSNHRKNEYINYILNNSDKKFVLSHLCDVENSMELALGYQWLRPDFVLSEGVNKIDNVIITCNSNKRIINDFKNKNSIYFSNYTYEKYDKLIIEDVYTSDKYINVIENCKNFITDGTAVFLADAFYNQKYSFSIPRFDDIESIINCSMNEYYGIGRNLNSNFESKKIDLKINDDVKFLSDYLGDL